MLTSRRICFQLFTLSAFAATAIQGKEMAISSEVIREFTNEQPSLHVAISASGTAVAYATASRVHAIDLESNSDIAFDESVSALALSRLGDRVLTVSRRDAPYAGGDRTLLSIKSVSGGASLTSSVRGSAAGITVCQFVNESVVACGDESGQIAVYDTERLGKIAAYKIHSQQVNEVAISPDGRFGISIDHGGDVARWKVDGSGNVLNIEHLIVPDTFEAFRAAVISNSGRSVVADFRGNVGEFSSASKTMSKPIKVQAKRIAAIYVNWDQGRGHLLGFNGRLCSFELADDTNVRCEMSVANGILDARFDELGAFMITSSEDRVVVSKVAQRAE